MYKASIPSADYHHPWEISFDERMTLLTRGSPRIAYFYSIPDTSTFRYRAYNVSQALAVNTLPNRISASWFTANDFDQMPRVLDSCDVLILCRNSLYTDRIARLAAQARARGRRILFDVDDLVFDPAYIHLLIDTLGLDMDNPVVWDYWFSYIGRVGATFALADGAVVTNNYLAARAESWSGKPAKVIPNFLNKEQQDISDRIWEAKEASSWARDGRTHIAYFSGSPSHNRDFNLVAQAIGQIMDEDDSIWLKTVGFLDPNSELSRHQARTESMPLQDFVNLQREIGSVEINIVPLQDNPFTHCKSELKWFEAAVVGALTVASPTEAYKNAIRHGVNGWLATTHGWKDTLKHVSRNFDTMCRQTTSLAKEEARELFGWDRQARRIEKAIFEDN